MDAFYARFFPGEEWNATAAYRAEVEGHLADQAKVLDLGCGDNTKLARFHTPAREVWGVDFQWHPRLQHAERFRRLAPDGGIPFPTATFDLVACSWVLEHVAEPPRFLGEVARVLRPGGRFVALTIHGLHYVTVLSRLVNLLPHRWTQELVWRLYRRPHEDTFPTHYRLNTSARLRRAAEATGLQLVALTRFANPAYFSFWRPAQRLAVLADWLLERLHPGLGRIYLVATLQKPGDEAGRLQPAA